MRQMTGVGLLIALLLAGCGEESAPARSVTVTNDETGEIVTATVDQDGNTTRYEVQTDGGETSTITVGDTKVPSNLPAYAQVYPGAKVVSTVVGQGQDGSGAILFMTTPDAPDHVASFYKKQFAAAGLTETAEASTEAGRMLSASGPDDKGAVAVLISAPDGEATHVQLNYGEGQ